MSDRIDVNVAKRTAEYIVKNSALHSIQLGEMAHHYLALVDVIKTVVLYHNKGCPRRKFGLEIGAGGIPIDKKGKCNCGVDAWAEAARELLPKARGEG